MLLLCHVQVLSGLALIAVSATKWVCAGSDVKPKPGRLGNHTQPTHAVQLLCTSKWLFQAATTAMTWALCAVPSLNHVQKAPVAGHRSRRGRAIPQATVANANLQLAQLNSKLGQ
jgi:hypothetical protein